MGGAPTDGGTDCGSFAGGAAVLDQGGAAEVLLGTLSYGMGVEF